MSNIDNWEKIYSNGSQINRWPFSDLISLFYRFSNEFRGVGMKVLELGCGTANNFRFFNSVGATYLGVEGSGSAVSFIEEEYSEFLAAGALRIVRSDILGFKTSENFDLILDRAALTHNSTADIELILSECNKWLVPQGLFIGIDWFSDKHSDVRLGTQFEDVNTAIEFRDGQFLEVGMTHFASKQHIIELFKDFDLLHLSEKVVTSELGIDAGRQFASWNIVARKKWLN